MSNLMYPVIHFIFLIAFINLASAAPSLTCTSLSTPAQVRAEGITERVGDIVLTCQGGTPGQQVTGNFIISLNAAITNRLAAGTSNVTGVVFTADSGSGPQAITAPGTLSAPNILQFAGASFTLSPTGTTILRLANIRVAANQLMTGGINLIQAQLSVDVLAVQNSLFTVGTIFRGLYAGLSQTLVCAQGGSPAAANPVSFASFLSLRRRF